MLKARIHYNDKIEKMCFLAAIVDIRHVEQYTFFSLISGFLDVENLYNEGRRNYFRKFLSYKS